MTDQAPTQHIATLSELLQKSDSQYRLYDIGRLVSKLPKSLFEKVENNQQPYPTPVQGHACFAIVFWQKQLAQPYLWLLKLPLDERGLLNQGARNHFIAIIIEALGEDLTQKTSKKQEELLSSNPYLFTPTQYKMASLNSKIKNDLKQPASEYLQPFQHYLTTENWSMWQEVGIQGITDFTARITQDNNVQLLQKALPNLPVEVLSPLCSALENEHYPVSLIDTLLEMFTVSIKAIDTMPKASLLLRALALESNHPHVKQAIKDLLAQEFVETELLITLTTRCWLALSEEKILIDYFEHLLKLSDSSLFESVFKDLVTIPSVRPIVLQCIRSQNRSAALAHAIGKLFN